MKNIFWTANCNEERNGGINTIQKVIAKWGNLVDFKFFSDISINLKIEIKERHIDQLYDDLKRILGIDQHEYLNSTSNLERNIFLNISFSKGTGNLKIETPSVPG